MALKGKTSLKRHRQAGNSTLTEGMGEQNSKRKKMQLNGNSFHINQPKQKKRHVKSSSFASSAKNSAFPGGNISENSSSPSNRSVKRLTFASAYSDVANLRFINAKHHKSLQPAGGHGEAEGKNMQKTVKKGASKASPSSKSPSEKFEASDASLAKQKAAEDDMLGAKINANDAHIHDNPVSTKKAFVGAKSAEDVEYEGEHHALSAGKKSPFEVFDDTLASDEEDNISVDEDSHTQHRKDGGNLGKKSKREKQKKKKSLQKTTEEDADEDDEAALKQYMKRLKETDIEFFQFLRKNDEDLLQSLSHSANPTTESDEDEDIKKADEFYGEDDYDFDNALNAGDSAEDDWLRTSVKAGAQRADAQAAAYHSSHLPPTLSKSDSQKLADKDVLEEEKAESGTSKDDLFTEKFFLDNFNSNLRLAEETTSLKALIFVASAFRSAARSLYRPEDEEDEASSAVEKGNLRNIEKKNSLSKKKNFDDKNAIKPPFSTHLKQKKQSKRRNPFMTNSSSFAADDELAVEIIEKVLLKMPALLDKHAIPPASKEEQRGLSAEKVVNSTVHCEGIIPVVKYHKWQKIVLILRMFLVDCILIINNGGAHSSRISQQQSSDLLGTVFVTFTNFEMLKWMMPFRLLLHQFLRSISRAWSMNSMQTIKLKAFLCYSKCCSLLALPEHNRLRASMTTNGPEGCSYFNLEDATFQAAEALQSAVRLLHREFLRAALRGYSWRKLSIFQFMENCLVELLCVDEELAYRVAFLSIKEMALTVRNTSVAFSQNFVKRKEGERHKYNAKLTALRQSLFSWAFILNGRLWVSAIGRIAKLKILAYPLVCVFGAALKMKIHSMAYLPFNLQLLRMLNQLAAYCGKLIPVYGYLSNLLSLLVDNQKKIRLEAIKTAKRKNRGDNAVAVAKPVDIDVTLGLGNMQISLAQTNENLFLSAREILVDHLGFLALHPSFPEVTFPVLCDLKALVKKIETSEFERKEYIQLLKNIEETMEAVKKKRHKLNVSQLLLGNVKVFHEEGDSSSEATPLLAYKKKLLEARNERIRQRVHAERSALEERKRVASNGAEQSDPLDDYEEVELTRSQIKRAKRRKLKLEQAKTDAVTSELEETDNGKEKTASKSQTLHPNEVSKRVDDSLEEDILEEYDLPNDDSEEE